MEKKKLNKNEKIAIGSSITAFVIFVVVIILLLTMCHGAGGSGSSSEISSSESSGETSSSESSSDNSSSIIPLEHYTVTWIVDSVTVDTNDDVTGETKFNDIKPVDPNKAADIANNILYTFQGWYVSTDDTKQIIDNSYVFSSDVSFVAYFTSSDYIDSLNYPGGTPVVNKDYTAYPEAGTLYARFTLDSPMNAGIEIITYELYYSSPYLYQKEVIDYTDDTPSEINITANYITDASTFTFRTFKMTNGEWVESRREDLTNGYLFLYQFMLFADLNSDDGAILYGTSETRVETGVVDVVAGYRVKKIDIDGNGTQFYWATADNAVFKILNDYYDMVILEIEKDKAFEETGFIEVYPNSISVVYLDTSKNGIYAGSITGGGQNLALGSHTLTAVPNYGYAFDGWYEWVDNGDGSSYTNKISSELTYEVNLTNDGYIAYVSFKVDPNVISFSPVTGNDGGLYTIEPSNDFGKFSASCLAFTDPHTYFIGWYSDEAGTELLSTDTIYTFDIFQGEKYNIYYKYVLLPNSTIGIVNGQDTTWGYYVTSYNTRGEMELTATARDGYTFVGWFKNQDGSGEPYTTSSSYTITYEEGALNLYAKFQATSTL
jgi:uncharacterized repeat protein (TIGR02543 family)